VYYRVPLPAGMEEPAGQRPEDAGQLSIINVRAELPNPCLLSAHVLLCMGVVPHWVLVTTTVVLYISLNLGLNGSFPCTGHLWRLPTQCADRLHGRDWCWKGGFPPLCTAVQ
jgi:hypothetical protein